MEAQIIQEQKHNALRALEERLDARLITMLNSCVRCGLCAGSCIYYRAMGDERYIPARKVSLLSSIYRRYFTVSGKMLPGLFSTRDLDDGTFEEMTDLFFGSCTACGRCNHHCSIGVDMSLITSVGRSMLSAAGLTPVTLQSTVDSALATGNNMGIPVDEFVDTIQWMEDELRDDLNDPDASIPLDESGKEVLYTLNPREPKFFPLSISAMAKIFYAAGESWTLSSRMYDVTNYAFFSGNRAEAALIAGKLHSEMSSLDAGCLVLAECGHGSRAFRWEAPNYLHTVLPYKVQTSVELIAGYIRDGRIKLDPERLKDIVTIHDPCNLVRSGGIINEQRFIVRKLAKNFVEMTPHGIDNLCCGGGGGQLAMSEYNDRRMKIGELKARQIRETGASIVVTPCHNCVDQLTQISHTYKLGVKIMTLAEVVSDALII